MGAQYDLQARKEQALRTMESLTDRMGVDANLRKQLYTSISNFSRAQPLLFTFLAIQSLLLLTPVLLFITFSTTTLLLFAVLALVFSLFWIGCALLLLVPTVLATVVGGSVLWLWAVTSLVAARYVWERLPTNTGSVDGIVGKREGERGIEVKVEG